MAKKPAYDPRTTLQPVALRGEVEELARRLYELSCCGSRAHWGEMASPDKIQNDRAFRRQFLTSAHRGMCAAQREIIDHIRSDRTLTPSHHVLFRGVADAMAWQLIGLQLCYARRLYKGHRQPDLRHSNFESVIDASEHMVRQEPGSVALISDLTSFVQVGDLLMMGPTGGLSFVEVKQGEKNKKISDFMDFYLRHGCERSLFYFAKEEGSSSVEQLGRMIRQASRMAHVTEVMSKGRSADPDTEQDIRIPEDFVFVDTWAKDLTRLLDECNTKPWAISMVDDCLFLGCYSEGHMQNAGHMAFNMWFDNCGGTPNCPRARLIDEVHHPLAPTLFNMDIPDEHKFDILFGRKHICMGLNMEAFLNQCKKAGLSVRNATKREASKMEQGREHPIRHKGKVVMIGNGKTEVSIFDGVFVRIMFHLQRPLHVIKALMDSRDENL